MASDMIGFYLGALLGVFLLVLFLKYVTACRLIMGMLIGAGLLAGAFLGFLLAWPLVSHFGLSNTGWVWAGPAVGALVWGLAAGRGLFRGASPGTSSSPRS